MSLEEKLSILNTSIQELIGVLLAKKENKEERERGIIPLVKWNEYHEWPTINGLRNMVFYSETNGMNKVIYRAGKKIFIDEKKFFDWIRSNPTIQPDIKKTLRRK